LAYGCLGDKVNLGSRLEGLNKMYRTQIIIGENTEQLVHGAFLLRELDVVRVKGKKKPVRIYELVDHAGRAPPGPEGDLLHHYAAGLEAYRQQHWQPALGHFSRCLEILPGDGPSQVMAERCRIYRETPPPEAWDGVFEHTHK
jgi:adenylate cyclase